MKHFQDSWNIMLATDSYKASHHLMLPDKLEYMESYFEARGGEFNFTLFFGMQYYLKSYLEGVQVTEEKIVEAVDFYSEHFGSENIFNEKGWRYILENYGGKLPIKIKAVKEGSIVPIKNILFKVSSIDKNCVFLVNWVETLLMKLWYTCTVATSSMDAKDILRYHAEISSESLDVKSKYVDFGFRGVATEEQAWLGGASHLLSFNVSDNVAGIRMLKNYYDAPMSGYSIPATEHSVMTLMGRENEIDTYKRIISKFKTGHLSLVSDTYDIYNVCGFLSSDKELKQMILDRDGVLVIRPDSGDPKEVLIKCLDILSEGFGYTTNSKGFKTLNDKIRLIQGDGIDNMEIHNILNHLEINGWSLDNLVFGSGGGLLQKFNRDTSKFAIKASYAIVDSKEVDVYKDPITSSGSKTSKKGKLFLLFNETIGYHTKNHHEMLDNPELLKDESMLQEVFNCGEILNKTTYSDIISRIESEDNKLTKIYGKENE